MTTTKDYGAIGPSDETDELVPPTRTHDDVPQQRTRGEVAWMVLLASALLVVAARWNTSSNGTSGNDLAASLALVTPAQEGAAKSSTLKIEMHDPTKPMYFEQIVDHNLRKTYHPNNNGTFKQKYFENLNYFKGPGYPIFLIFGGEGPQEKILYPFVSEILAAEHGAITINNEHRYV
jgi:hypothetical protein